MAAHQAGRLAEADALYRRAIEASPPDARRKDPACAVALANLGALLQYRGHIIEAIGFHRRALELEPRDVEVRCNLAKALVESGAGDEALRLCEAGLAAAPGHPLVLAARGAVLCDLERYGEAVAVLESATRLSPDDDLALVNLAYARIRRGDVEPAIAALRSALRANPDGGRATADLVNLLSGTGRHDEALALADDYLVAHPGERHVLAAQIIALRDAGRAGEAAGLANLDQFVRVSEPPVPQGFASIDEFNQRLRTMVEADPSLLASPPSKSTRGGFQTGELDLDRDPALRAYGALIDSAVREAVAAFTAGGLSNHPLMAYAAPSWALRAWGTILDAGGRQAPHIHPLGWLSAVYYVQVPDDMAAAGPQAGWLEFGTPPDRLLQRSPPVTRAIQPREGRLVLFPSYFYHQTVPFESRGRRISLAVDVMPR